MGFVSRLFRTRKPAEPAITDNLLIPSDRPALGTFDGNPSAVDELGRVTGGMLGSLDANLYAAGADMAVDADIGRDMQSEGDRLDESENHMWDTLAAGTHDDDEPHSGPDVEPDPP